MLCAHMQVEALRKMERFNVKIGFPDKWIDYTTLVVHRGKLLQNVAAGRAFAFQLDLLRINEPTEKHRWYFPIYSRCSI
jgi:putative endopeptidase